MPKLPCSVPVIVPTTSEIRDGVRYLLDIIEYQAQQLVTDHWNQADIAQLAAGHDHTDTLLPPKGYVALGRLGWTPTKLPDFYAPSRVGRISGEIAARLLRAAVYREQLVGAIVVTWPMNPKRRTADEWTALNSVLPENMSKVEVRSRTRQIAAYKAKCARLPVSIVDLEQPPRVIPEILLAAVDKQFAVLARDADGCQLKILLPTLQRPRSQTDWQWYDIPFVLPQHVPTNAILHKPTVRLVKSKVWLDVPFDRVITTTKLKGHTRALGLDWGVNTLYTGSIGKLYYDQDGVQRVATDGYPLVYDASGVTAKVHRLRVLSEQIQAKIDRLRALRQGCYNPDLQISVLEVEREYVDRRRKMLDRSLSWSAASWAVGQAVALGCTAIFVEDLASLEAGGLGRRTNVRVSGQVRGMVLDALRHQAAKAGVAVVLVEARGTSSGCPRCCKVLSHVRAPDRLTVSGYRWSYCSNCRLSLDRDHAASMRVVGRGLLSQGSAYREFKKSSGRCRSVVDGPVASALRSRDRFGPCRSVCRMRPLRLRSFPPERSVGTSFQGGGVVVAAVQAGVVKRIKRPLLGGCVGFSRLVCPSPVVVLGDWGPGRSNTLIHSST